MNNPHKNLLALVKLALFKTPIELKEAEWPQLLTLAKEHAIIGLLYEAITLLPEELRPDKAIIHTAYAYVTRIEKQNLHLNQCLISLVKEYEQLGFQPTILKGSGVAANYTHPLWRMSGDIDLSINASFEALEKWATSQAIVLDDFNPRIHKHAAFEYQGVHIEPHFQIARLPNRALNKKLEEIIKEGLTLEQPLTLTLNEEPIRLLPPTLGLLHLLLHFTSHVVNEGIGLRQYSDILMYMHTHCQKINGPLLDRWLKTLELHKLSEALATTSLEVGLPAESIPYSWSTNPKGANTLFHLIFRAGNFGRSYQIDRTRFTWRLDKSRRMIGRAFQLYHIVPQHLLQSYWNAFKNGYMPWLKKRR